MNPWNEFDLTREPVDLRKVYFLWIYKQWVYKRYEIREEFYIMFEKWFNDSWKLFDSQYSFDF
jgi:hypothetical protein